MLIKICGITDEVTAAAVCSDGAEMVGLMFVPDSPRVIAVDQAMAIKQVVAGRAATVAVFRDQPLADVRKILDHLQPDYVQLHGQETAEYCSSLEVPVIKALTLEATVNQSRQKLLQYQGVCQYFLIDRKIQGTGPLIAMNQIRELSSDFPIIVAGGLTPANITEVLDAAGPSIAGVDVSSGVEDTLGHKNTHLITAFISQVRSHHVS